MTSGKPTASLSLDLDNKWSYMKTHGDPRWETLPSYFDIVVPRFLEMLHKLRLTITVFVVGQDAAIPANAPSLRSIGDAGHEIGNHSFHHEPWLHLYSREQAETEIEQAEQSIEAATGKRPIGFRGPGFSVSRDILSVLSARGYLYDASTFPTFLGPLARTYYFLTAKLTPEQRAERKLLFGSMKEGFRPLKPYSWNIDGTGLIEIPVTTMPWARLPIHLSYVLYISAFSPAAGLAYFRAALAMCRLAGVAPSLLLHPLDFLGLDDAPELEFFPAMRVDWRKKAAVVERALELFAERYNVLSMERQAREYASSGELARVEPRFQWS